MNNPAPVQTSWLNNLPTPAWANWFQQVFTALSGWSSSSKVSLDFNFGAIPAQSELSTTTTVAGARSGATVIVAPLLNTAGIFYTGVVTADDTVTLYAKNFTAGVVNPASTTFRIIVLQN